MTFTLAKRAGRPAWLGASLAILALPLAGCLGSGGGSNDDVLSGTFVDSPVAGLDYQGSQTAASKTGEGGEFSYRSGEILTFAIGNLVLGRAAGGQLLTPLDLVDGAAGADDQRVLNQLILLQSLDADGNLNNGIQISSQIRDEVSLVAGTIEFDQSPSDFRAAIAGLIADLEAAGAFSDTDPRERTVAVASDALEHFQRSTAERHLVSTTVVSCAVSQPPMIPGSFWVSPRQAAAGRAALACSAAG
ncbi:hypothetical protein ULG90_00165 [Halopseudomonas pachastrellae]|nr:hypothetical protein ULG90_00165 [Halopseudomonas pachastrellae]